jgi:hypothetical protein
MQRLSHSWEKLRSWSTIAFIVNENMSSQYALLEFSQSFIISHWLKMRSPHLSNYKAYSKFKWGNDLVSEQFPPFFRICFSSKYSKIYTTTAVIYVLMWIDPIFHLYCHIFLLSKLLLTHKHQSTTFLELACQFLWKCLIFPCTGKWEKVLMHEIIIVYKIKSQWLP